MTLLPQTLTQMNTQLANYTGDQRPLNIDEMWAFKRILDQLAKELAAIYRATPIKSIPQQVRNNWMNLKTLIGDYSLP